MADELHHAHAGAGEIELLRVQGHINAEPILAALRANGIPARTVGEALGSVYGLTLDGIGEVAILVACEHEAAALLEKSTPQSYHSFRAALFPPTQAQL